MLCDKPRRLRPRNINCAAVDPHLFDQFYSRTLIIISFKPVIDSTVQKQNPPQPNSASVNLKRKAPFLDLDPNNYRNLLLRHAVWPYFVARNNAGGIDVGLFNNNAEWSIIERLYNMHFHASPPLPETYLHFPRIFCFLKDLNGNKRSSNVDTNKVPGFYCVVKQSGYVY